MITKEQYNYTCKSIDFYVNTCHSSQKVTPFRINAIRLDHLKVVGYDLETIDDICEILSKYENVKNLIVDDIKTEIKDRLCE